MVEGRYELALIGLGVMGRNLLLNMADHGYSVAGYDSNPAQVDILAEQKGNRDIKVVKGIEELIESIRGPRAILILVPAGGPVDEVIDEMAPHLARGDIIMDGGNSLYRDTEIRGARLHQKGISYLGIGISGGEAGARHGPSIMAGGPRDAYERVRSMFEAAAAKVNGEPCISYLGPRSAGHYVKMVHNGIEYGLMQLIAEIYDLMKTGVGLSNGDMAHIFEEWNKGRAGSYLIDITARILTRLDTKTGNDLIDVILDGAEQTGTGRWVSQDAMEQEVPIPTIDAAVWARELSAMKEERAAAARRLRGPLPGGQGRTKDLMKGLGDALYGVMAITYGQGMALLRRASTTYDYSLNLADVARIWRGGCIIRAEILEDIRKAYERLPELRNLLADGNFAEKVGECQQAVRDTITYGAQAGIPLPAFMATLSYYDGYRSGRLPANLIQAQRDYFGAHKYERVDERGWFHTDWEG